MRIDPAQTHVNKLGARDERHDDVHNVEELQEWAGRQYMGQVHVIPEGIVVVVDVPGPDLAGLCSGHHHISPC